MHMKFTQLQPVRITRTDEERWQTETQFNIYIIIITIINILSTVNNDNNDMDHC